MSSLSRREWTLAAIGLAGSPEADAAWQHAHQGVTSAAPPRLETLDPATAKEIEALVSRIIPSDGTPGAREAGAIYFIDRALGGWLAEHLPAYREGLSGVQKIRAAMFPGSAGIAELSGADQDRLVAAFEKTPFFELLRAHTALGFLGSPVHGGNRGAAGWALIGFEDKASFSPPFGYYDAEAMKEAGR